MARDSAAKAKGNRIFRYVKNVGRSFGYIALSTAADQNDFIADMVKQNKDMAQSIYTAIKAHLRTVLNGSKEQELSMLEKKLFLTFSKI